MKRFIFFLIVITLVLSMTLVGYMNEEKLEWNKNWPQKVRIGCGSMGGGFYMAGSSLANVLKVEFPEIEFIVEQTKASVHNIKLIEAGEVEFALATTDTVYPAWRGAGSFEGKKYRRFRVFMPGWPVPFMFVTLKKSGIKNFNEFAGKKISPFHKGGANDYLLRRTLEALGIEAQIVNLGITDAMNALKIGTIEGIATGHPNPATQQLAMTTELRILGLDTEQGELLVSKYPETIYPVTVPAGYYKGQNEPVDSSGNYNICIVRKDLPEDMVYTVIKALYKHKDIIEATWPLMARSMDYDLVKFMNTPIHKGSIRYYSEIGSEIPENLILND